jgi:hypothetical protein
MTQLLNEDGSASNATMIMLSHHAFRRDMLRFIRAIEQIKAGDTSRNDAVREEWEKSYKMALHGHHTAEDTRVFPDIRSRHPDLGVALDKLTDQHHHIDPLIEKGDIAFADLAHPEYAEVVLSELQALLHEHLAFEELEVIPALREQKSFPVPEDQAAMFADGFAWSMQGIAPEVLEKMMDMLPAALTEKIPAARAKFEEHSKKVWGAYNVGSATTPVPTDY